MDKKLVNNRFGLPRRLVAAVILLIMMAASLSPAAAAGPQTNCFISPGACGYPDPAYHNVGVTDCSALPNFSFSSLPPGTYWSGTGNTLEIVSNNVTLSNFNMGDATIYVSDVNNFTLNNVCIRANGNADQGSMAVNISGLSDGTTIENSNISGINDTTEALGMAVLNNGSNTLIRSNYVYNVGSGAPGSGGGSSTVEDNYELVNSVPAGEHDEDIYLSDNTITVHHNVLLNEEEQTAAIFGNVNGGAGGACNNHLTVTNNLMAGGDYILYPCGNASSVGSSTSDIENNAFARCGGGVNISPPGDPGVCAGGADSHGYYPFGGTFGLAAYFFTGAGQTWCGNHWDDTGQYVDQSGNPDAACPNSDPGGGGTSGGGSSSNSSPGTTSSTKAPDTGMASVKRPAESTALPFVLTLGIVSATLGRRILKSR